MSDLSSESRTAFVTGGAIGIGRAIVLALAAAGASVEFTYRSHGPEEVIKEGQRLCGTVMATELDVTNSEAVDQVVQQSAKALGGRIDLLVNNAGGLVDRVPVASMPNSHWDTVLSLNLSSTLYCIRAALPYLTRGSRIINISSLAAQTGGGVGAAAYASAKAGVDGLTRALAKELGPAGIRVNAIAPGLILDTPFHETFSSQHDQDQAVAATPLQIPGRPEDVAGAVLYLASDQASYVSGAVLDVNGGSHFH